MLISVIIQIRSKLNYRFVKLGASLTKLGGKTYIEMGIEIGMLYKNIIII